MALGLVSNRVYDWPIRLKTSRLDRLRVSRRQLSESDHLLVKPTKRLVVRVDRWRVDACEKSTPAKTGEATSRKVSLWVHTPPSLSWLTPGGQPILTPGVTTWVVCIGLESRRDQPTDRSTANRLSAPISVQSPHAVTPRRIPFPPHAFPGIRKKKPPDLAEAGGIAVRRLGSARAF